MPRETKEERQAREAREREAAEAALAAYYASVPKRLMDAQALAQTLGVSVHVRLTATGPSVHFELEDEGRKIYIDDTLTYQVEQWELEMLEEKLQRMKDEADARAARYKLAQSVFDTMTDDVKKAIKEHIYSLR